MPKSRGLLSPLINLLMPNCTDTAVRYWGERAKYKCLKGLSSPHVHSWLLCHKLIDHIYIDLFLGSLVCSIDLCFCFYAKQCYFDYYRFEYNLQLGSLMPPALFSFLKIALGSIDILTIFVLPIQEHGIFFHFFVSSSISSISFQIGRSVV